MARPSEHLSGPPARVLDLFAVPDDPAAIGGGSFSAGDLALAPGRDPVVSEWLNPVLARLAVRLDEEGGGLRVAMPVPARDGSWVVEGWGASRFEPGTSPCRDLRVVLAAGRLLHARLASVVPVRPDVLDARTDRWALAERLAFGPYDDLRAAGLASIADRLDDTPLGPDQLVHADLAGNVLLDARGSAVVIDVSPAWRPVRWAEAVCVLDAVVRFDVPERAVVEWGAGDRRQAMLRALAFRWLSDPDPAPYEPLLALL